MMGNMNKENTKLKIHKQNDLIQARYGAMTLHEQLLLLAVIGKVDPRQLTAETAVELSVASFADVADISEMHAYDDLQRAVKRLYDRSVTIDNPDPDEPALKRTETRWVSSINYFPGQGRIKLYFAPKILPYLANLRNNYTAYFLRHVSKFRSKYSVRLYELLVQWQSRGEREVEIEWLREHWQLQDKYSAIKDLKKWVIEPALRDINEFSNLWVKIGQRKRGRRVHSLQFRFGLKQQEKKKLDRGYIEKHAKPGETWDNAYKRLKNEK